MFKKIAVQVLFIIVFLGFYNNCSAWEQEELSLPSITSLAFSLDGKKIAFCADLIGYTPGDVIHRAQIWIINTDGTDLKMVTPLRDYSDGEPSWSPNGTQLIFSSYDGTTYDSHLWIINIDGTNLHQITFGGKQESTPAWSPDGSKVVYIRDNTLWLCDINGSNEKQLTTSVATYPQWSPDGKILFSGDIGSKTYNADEKVGVWEITQNGTDLKLLFDPSPYRIIPKISPDGMKFVFSKFHEDGGSYGIWMCNIDGTTWQRISQGQEADEDQSDWPIWSPDGSKIAYAQINLDESTATPASINISLINNDGTNLQRLITFSRTTPFAEFSLNHWRISWDQGKHDKNKFQLSGRIDLPDDYTLGMLQKKGIVNIAIEKKDSEPFSQTTTLDFKQNGPIWRYKAPKAQTSTEPLDIEKMLIFWQPEGSEGKPDKQGHAGKGHGKRAGWFMIQGNINISDTDQAALLPKAALTLNIPVENITTAGALESREEIEFNVNKNLWSYNAAPHHRWQDWQESWWEKVKED